MDKLCSGNYTWDSGTSDAPALSKPDSVSVDNHCAIIACHKENRKTVKKNLSFLIPEDEYNLVRKRKRVMRTLCILMPLLVTGAFKF